MNLSENWELRIDGAVYKELGRFPRKDTMRIIRIFENPHFNPYSGDIEKIKGEENVWRRRIGSYRI